MERLIPAILTLLILSACDQSLKSFDPVKPPPDLLEVTPNPVPTGDKGKDALTFAEAFTNERCKVLGWQNWYIINTSGEEEVLVTC